MQSSATTKKKKKVSEWVDLLRSSTSKRGKVIGLFLLAVFLIFALSLCYLGSAAGSGEKVTIKIDPQSSTSEIAAKLADQGLIHSVGYFKLYAHFTGADRSLKAGKYSFAGTESLAEIIKELQKGTPETFSFTIPEGYKLEEIINLLDSKEIVPREEFLSALKKNDFSFPYLNELSEGETKFEGFLFPDTYNVAAGMKANEVIQMMLDRFSEVYTPEFQQRARELDMSTNQVITLASIIEREAKKPQERPLISAVFHNRLNIGMALQSCATIQYAIGENKPVLYYTDLQIESPYNTYKNTGLPPGPISAPGRESIKAALYPAEVSYLYFVAKPDGSHAFSNTLNEHNLAKKKYLK